LSEAEERDARELLCRRLESGWVEGVLARAVTATRGPLELATCPAPQHLPSEGGLLRLSLAPGDAVGLATILGEHRAAVLLVGAAGSGKTVRLLQTLRLLIDRARADLTAPLPVVLDPSTWTDGALGPWLTHQLVARYGLARDRSAGWVEAHRLILLIDGLDELEAALRAPFLDALNDFRESHPTAFLLTCREQDYRRLGARCRCDTALRTQPLEEDVVVEALARHQDGPSSGRPGHAEVELLDPLCSPLLLSLFLELRDDLPQLAHHPNGTLRERLYAGFVGQATARAPGTDPNRSLSALRWLAEAMARTERAELWLDELQVECLPTRGQRALVHALTLGATLLGAWALHAAVALGSGHGAGDGIAWGTAAVASALLVLGDVRVPPAERPAWSWSRWARRLPRTVGAGALTGTAWGLACGTPVPAMALGALVGLVLSPAAGGRPAARDRPVRPAEGLRASLGVASAFAPLAGSVLAVALWALAHLLPGVAPEAPTWIPLAATAGATSTWLVTGAWAPIAHAALRIVLSLTSPLPLRLEPWLDGWVRTGLLWRVGSGWTFRHPTLRAWLTAREDSAGPATTAPVWQEAAAQHALVQPPPAVARR
jgi:hypothetical protein